MEILEGEPSAEPPQPATPSASTRMEQAGSSSQGHQGVPANGSKRQLLQRAIDSVKF